MVTLLAKLIMCLGQLVEWFAKLITSLLQLVAFTGHWNGQHLPPSGQLAQVESIPHFPSLIRSSLCVAGRVLDDLS